MKKDIFKPFIKTKTNKLKYLRKNIISKNPTLYLDYTASGLAFKAVEKRVKQVLKTYGNTHSEESSNAQVTHFYYEKARENLHNYFNLNDQFTVLPAGQGATGAIKYFQELMGIYIPPVTRKNLNLKVEKSTLTLVIVGPYEHHSNEISYKEGLCETIRVPITHEGLIDFSKFEEILINNSHRKIIGAFAVASNVSGIISPYKKISLLLRKYKALVCFDAATAAAYTNIDCKYYDALVCSPHKLLGGPGSCGLLIIKKALIQTQLCPTFCAGGTVEYVNKTKQVYKQKIEEREEAGTPPILQLIRASLAFQLRNELGFEFIEKRKKLLTTHLIKELQTIPNIKIYGNLKKNNIGIISFNLKNRSPYTLCLNISQKKLFQTRAGCSCAGPYGHDLLNIEEVKDFKNKPGWLRVSVHFTQTKKALSDFVKSLKEELK